MILVIILEQKTTKIKHMEGLHVETVVKPEPHVFQDLSGANTFLESNTKTILGVYELIQDFTGMLQDIVLPRRGTQECKQIVLTMPKKCDIVSIETKEEVDG